VGFALRIVSLEKLINVIRQLAIIHVHHYNTAFNDGSRITKNTIVIFVLLN